MYLCFRHNPRPPDLPPSHFGHRSLSTGATNTSDGQQIPNKPRHLDAEIQGMLSKLRQSSSKQPLLRQAPRPLERGSPGDPSVFKFQHHAPELPRQRGPPPQVFGSRSSTEHDQHLRSSTRRTGFGTPDRRSPFEHEECLSFSVSESELGNERDENDRQWEMSGTHRDTAAPPPMRFRPDLPRPPPMPQLRGMRPMSLMALDVPRPASLRHQQPTPSQKDVSRPPILLQEEQNHPSYDEEIQDQRPPSPMNRDNFRPPPHLQQHIERPPSRPGGQRSVSMQNYSRPPHADEHIRPPAVSQGFRPPHLPSARQPSLTHRFRLPHSNEDSSPLQQQSIPQQSLLPQQNFQRPPSFFQNDISKPSSLEGDQFPSQGQMRKVPSRNELQTATDLPRRSSREMQQNVDAGYDLSGSGIASREEMHRPHQTLKAAPPSLMDLNVRRPPVKPALLPSSSCESMSGVHEPDATAMMGPAAQQPFSEQPGLARSEPSLSVSSPHHVPSSFQVGMSGRMPPHSVDKSFQHNQPALGMRPPFPSSTAVPPSVGNQSSGAGSYPVGMLDEPLQFTGRMQAPHMRFPSQLQHIPIPGSGVRPTAAPQSAEDRHQVQGASNYPVGQSDEPLQFTGRMPAPRIRGPSYPQQQLVPGPGICPLGAPQAVRDNQQTQGLVGQSDEPLQFTGRMPVPRVQGPPYPHQQRMPNSGIRPLGAPHSVGDNQQTQGLAGQSDEPLQFTGRMPVPRVQGPSSYQQPQCLPNSSSGLNSTAVSTPGQTLPPPVRMPHGMPPPFIGMPPLPLAPPQRGSGPRIGMPSLNNTTRVVARMPQPFPVGAGLHHPVAGSIPLPRSEMVRPLSGSVASIVLPPPAVPQPFFSSLPNLVSC